MIFRALVEATAFGSRAIVERFRAEHVRIDEVIGIGGIALKSPFVMQTLSDVLNMPIKVCNTDQACALGAAMFAATAAGAYASVEEAQAAMNPVLPRSIIRVPNKLPSTMNFIRRYLALVAFTEQQVR